MAIRLDCNYIRSTATIDYSGKILSMMQDIDQVVIKAIAKQKQIDASTITADSTLAVLGISSLEAITIIFEIEEQFDVEVPNENLDSLETVQDIIDGIRGLIASKN